MVLFHISKLSYSDGAVNKARGFQTYEPKAETNVNLPKLVRGMSMSQSLKKLWVILDTSKS